jgi:hypothetical protein
VSWKVPEVVVLIVIGVVSSTVRIVGAALF